MGLELITSPILLDDIENNRDAFLRLRKTYIGASDVATILGLNKYKTPVELWAQKLGKVKDTEDNDRLWYGREAERLVAGLYERRYGWGVTKVNKVYRHPTIEWLSASPDYLTGEDSVFPLECKTTGVQNKDEWSDDKAPDLAHVQLLTQMAVLGAEKGRCGCIIAGDTSKAFFPKFGWDQELWNVIYGRLSQFHTHLISETIPEVRAGDLEVLDLLYRAVNTQCLELEEDHDRDMLFDSYKSTIKNIEVARMEVKRLDAVKARQEAQMRLMMKDYKSATYKNFLLEVKNVKRKGYTVKETEYTQFKVKANDIEEDYDE